MIMFNTKSGMDNPVRINELVYQMIKDLEDTRWKYHGYSYVRTMRNILIGKTDAAISPYFADKEYHGLFNELTLEQVEQIMDTFVNTNQLECIFTDHGKLYCTKEYHNYLSAKKNI